MSVSVVVDCSITSGWFLQDEISVSAQRLLKRVLEEKIALIVPELWWYETLNVLRSAVIRGRISREDARKSLYFLEEVPLETVNSTRIGHAAILGLAQEQGLSAYDATYLALAETRGCGLVTADRHLLDLGQKFPFITTQIP